MTKQTRSYTPASYVILRWLTRCGPDVPAQIRDVLFGELFTSPFAVIAGVLSGLLLNGAAIDLRGGRSFAAFMAIELGLAAARLWVLRRVAVASIQGRQTPTDLYLFTAILWSALQGAIAFMAMLSGIQTLQILAAATIMALLGPLCARNYPAPRLASLLVCLCILPFVAGAALSGNRWLLVFLLQLPLFMSGSMAIVRRLHGLSIATLQAQHESLDVARHDPLTGLWNRFGLTEILSRQSQAVDDCFSLFYLDLDGFKLVNDRLGHHAGDDLLRAVAQRLKASIRSGDAVARLGGDEFVILAPGLAAAASRNFAEDIIRSIGGQPYQLETGPPVRIGISIGYACAPEDGTTLMVLHRKADTALYAAKAEGKGIERRFQSEAAIHPFRSDGVRELENEEFTT